MLAHVSIDVRDVDTGRAFYDARPSAARVWVHKSCEVDGRLRANFLDYRWGESGGGARPMHPDWLRGFSDQVHAAGAKLFVKQIGTNHALWPSVSGKGEDPTQWPADLRVQEFPQ